MKILGITGNSGSGKSYISSILKKYGGYIIDADKLGHQILKKNGLAYKEVVDAFGEAILDNNFEISRKKLGEIVFFDEKKLAVLSKISHRYIKILINQIIEEKNMENQYKFIVIDGAVLLECDIDKICQIFVLVEADYDIKLERIIKRDFLTREMAKNRLSMQTNFANLQHRFTHIVYNNGEFSLDEIIEELLSNTD